MNDSDNGSAAFMPGLGSDYLAGIEDDVTAKKIPKGALTSPGVPLSLICTELNKLGIKAELRDGDTMWLPYAGAGRNEKRQARKTYEKAVRRAKARML